MKKVFLVTEGHYSDWNVVAVFSTREKAQAYLFHLQMLDISLDDPTIDEWEMDLTPKQWVTTSVRMDKDGKVLNVNIDKNRDHGFVCFDIVDNLYWSVRTANKEKAIKVVNEKRAQLIALGLWGNTNHEKVRSLIEKGEL